ncbi:MAG TPA: class I SAM-dependent methyltransferase [Allosphingosinicella sp.]|nr:class I SAM-dependent methyltransferase [Allosphingosinicella sp.]
MSGGFIDKFSAFAGAYQESRPTYPAHLFAALGALAPGRDLAWDAGTGNGQAALGLAAQFDRVYATDPSAGQIGEATPHDRIDYAVERAEAVSLPDGSADLVLAAQSLHWFDLELFYAEARRVLKPGGILAAAGYDWMYVSPEIDRAINERLLPPLAPHWAPQNALLWAGYRSIPFPGEEIRLGAFAIYLDWSFDDVRAYAMSWSAVRALVEAEGEGAILPAMDAVAAVWGAGLRRLVMPLHLRIARL